MRGKEGDAQRLVAIGQRHLELRRRAEPCGNSGNHRIGDAGVAQRLDLLAAAAEDEGIAALQPHRALAGFRGIDQQLVDRVLPDAGLADAATDRNARGVAADAIKNFGRDQFVVEHDVGILQRAQRLDGQQIRIARPRADQRDVAFGLAVCDAPAKADGIVDAFSAPSASSLRPASTNSPIGPSITRSQKRRRSGEFGDAGMNRLAPAADEAGEIADARGQHRFDALAHTARDHRRRAAGADRDHDVAAIDDRRKDEGGMREVVHHVDGKARGLRPRRHASRVACTGARTAITPEGPRSAGRRRACSIRAAPSASSPAVS